MNELHLFAGAGGGILGSILLGHTCVCAVEIEPYCRKVLLQRQRDGMLPEFPIWDDVRTFDGKPWRGRVDVIAGGFPCQDISVAGKGAGLDGARSGLWSEFARIIGEVGPRFVFVENSPALTGRGLGTVLGDLAALGFDARWGVLGAIDAGAPHRRERIWIVAHAAGNTGKLQSSEREDLRDEPAINGTARTARDVADANCGQELQPCRCERDEWGRACNCGEDVADAEHDGFNGTAFGGSINTSEDERRLLKPKGLSGDDWWAAEPAVGRMAHELARRLDRSGAITTP